MTIDVCEQFVICINYKLRGKSKRNNWREIDKAARGPKRINENSKVFATFPVNETLEAPLTHSKRPCVCRWNASEWKGKGNKYRVSVDPLPISRFSTVAHVSIVPWLKARRGATVDLIRKNGESAQIQLRFQLRHSQQCMGVRSKQQVSLMATTKYKSFQCSMSNEFNTTDGGYTFSMDCWLNFTHFP